MNYKYKFGEPTLFLSVIFILLSVGQTLEQIEHNEAFAASETFKSRTPFDWFIDSGASESFTDQLQIITDFTPIAPGSMMVCGIGGISLEVRGIGNVHIIAEVDLTKNNCNIRINNSNRISLN